MPHPLERRVVRTIRQHALVTPGDRVAIAVSGGADSVALVWLLREAVVEPGVDAAVVGLIHVNHLLRGDESERDEAFCRALADRLGWQIEVGRADVAGAARASGRSVEVEGRNARYGFFTEAARRLGATRVATAHTVDDQAETVLLRLLRGTGGRGVTGIRLRRGPFVRPLLDCRRADLRRYLAARGESFCEDSSNRDESIARNRVRHRLLPVIEQIAPSGVRALARFATLAGDDEDYLNQAAIEVVSTVVLIEEGRGPIKIDAAALNTLPGALSRRVVRRVVEQVAPAAALTLRHIEAVRRLARADKPSGHLDLPDVVVDRCGDAVCVSRRPRAAGGRVVASGPTAPFEKALPIPGVVDLPEAGVTLTASAVDSLERLDRSEKASGRGDAAMVQAGAVAMPLVVRSRRRGDRFRPLGAPGRRKLQDLLVDRKVPRQERDRVPIVVDASGRIVWVVGVAIAEECRVTRPAAGVVILRVHRST